MSSTQERKLKSICALLEECREGVRRLKERKDREPKSTVLTYEASRLHYKLEEAMSDVRKFADVYSNYLTKNLPMSTLETVLPDLLVAAVLWFKENELLDEIDQMLICLECLLNDSKKELEEKVKEETDILGGRLKGLLVKAERLDPQESESNLLKNHDFLSQQIDERSHQFFTMGSLFVPVSFLVFASAVTGIVPRFLEGVPLAFASLTCYLTWFVMYLRSGKLSEYSYPVIHSLELILGLSTHSTLNEIRKKDRLLKIRQQPFYITLYMLVTL